MNINQPVTNPVLTAALDALIHADTPDTRQQVALELNRATYLVAMLDDELTTTPGAAPGQVTLTAGSRLKLLTCDDGQGGQFLPLFTDWDAVRAWAARPVSGLVLPAAEAWQFALADTTYAGIVINPAHHSVVLSREVLARMG